MDGSGIGTETAERARLSSIARRLEEAERLANFGSFEFDVTTRQLYWSAQLFRIYGLNPDEFTPSYEGFLRCIHPDDRARVETLIRELVRDPTPRSVYFDERIVRPDGEIRLLESGLELVTDGAGHSLRILGTCHDVTEVRAAEGEREKASLRIQQIFERVTDAFVALDRDWRFTYLNQKAALIFNRRPEELIGKQAWAEYPEAVGLPFYFAFQEALRTQQTMEIGEYYPLYDRWFEIRIYPSPDGLSIYFRDVTARKRQEQAVRELHARLEKTEQYSLVMVTHIGLSGQWLKVPQRFCKLLQEPEEVLLSAAIGDYVFDEDMIPFRIECQKLITGDLYSFDHELRFAGRAGEVIWIDANISSVQDERGNVLHFVGYLRDISERKRAEERIEFHALHDVVTGLPNRLLFEDRLTQAIAHAPGLGRPVGVMVLDFDHFKRINDRFGHAVGDLVLKEASQRLRRELKETETMARVAGDEFAVIAAHVKHDHDVTATAERLMAALQQPFEVSGESIRLSASLGVALFPVDGTDADTLLRNAHSAVYRAKERGRNIAQMFEPVMNERYRARLEMEEDLHGAVDRDEIECFYQPIFQARDHTIAGVEALVRWRHPRRGLVLPDDFIPACEESRLIDAIGSIVLRKASRQVGEWQRRFGPLRLAVNLSVRQFHQRHLVESIRQTLAEAEFDPAMLELEITESVAMENAEWTMSLLRALRDQNIRIVIDDFGAGQSSLIYLRQFPINLIKIDKVFVRDILADRTNSAIVRAVVSLVHDLGLEVSAEGVESSEQLAVLEAYGCDLLQGFYFSRPVPASEMEALLSASHSA